MTNLFMARIVLISLFFLLLNIRYLKSTPIGSSPQDHNHHQALKTKTNTSFNEQWIGKNNGR
ncbi:unnamed protein product [Meloidogyne enterolobii]|uniref:Uncharacterized protein n=1 Tax=Meloidogyne enterolobii TaxID=390850 RepID=A0ACB1B6N3_MELEN